MSERVGQRLLEKADLILSKERVLFVAKIDLPTANGRPIRSEGLRWHSESDFEPQLRLQAYLPLGVKAVKEVASAQFTVIYEATEASVTIYRQDDASAHDNSFTEDIAEAFEQYEEPKIIYASSI